MLRLSQLEELRVQREQDRLEALRRRGTADFPLRMAEARLSKATQELDSARRVIFLLTGTRRIRRRLRSGFSDRRGIIMAERRRLHLGIDYGTSTSKIVVSGSRCSRGRGRPRCPVSAELSIPVIGSCHRQKTLPWVEPLRHLSSKTRSGFTV